MDLVLLLLLCGECAAGFYIWWCRLQRMGHCVGPAPIGHIYMTHVRHTGIGAGPVRTGTGPGAGPGSSYIRPVSGDDGPAGPASGPVPVPGPVPGPVPAPSYIIPVSGDDGPAGPAPGPVPGLVPAPSYIRPVSGVPFQAMTAPRDRSRDVRPQSQQFVIHAPNPTSLQAPPAPTSPHISQPSVQSLVDYSPSPQISRHTVSPLPPTSPLPIPKLPQLVDYPQSASVTPHTASPIQQRLFTPSSPAQLTQAFTSGKSLPSSLQRMVDEAVNSAESAFNQQSEALVRDFQSKMEALKRKRSIALSKAFSTVFLKWQKQQNGTPD